MHPGIKNHKLALAKKLKSGRSTPSEIPEVNDLTECMSITPKNKEE